MGRIHIETGRYEPHETIVVQRILKPGQMFVDVGAHIGYYTVMAANIVGPSGCVHAFEPDEGNISKLVANTSYFNGIVQVYASAVSDRAIDCASLYLSDTNSGDHRLYATPDRESIEVSVTTLDADIEPPVDFLKIDVQGWETHVLRGARDLIEGSPNLTGLIELSPGHLKLAGSSSGELMGLLSGMGFNVFDRECRRIDPAHYPRFAQRKNHVNLFFSRRESI